MIYITSLIANISRDIKRQSFLVVRYQYWLSMKLYKSSSSIGFIKKCLYLNVIPKFANLQGQFLNKNERDAAEQNLLISLQ